MNDTLFALVVNPRRSSLVQCCVRGNWASVWDAVNVEAGSGYWNDDSLEWCERVTGYPRAHLPDGVARPGGGWGTALYVAMAVGAQMRTDGLLPMARMHREGAGLSSDARGRTPPADRWWAQATRRGLAHQVVAPQPRGVGGRKVAPVDAVADAFPAARAVEQHLVVARFPRPRRGVSELFRVSAADAEVVDAEVVDAEALAAVRLDDLTPFLRADADPAERDDIERQLGWLLDLGVRAGLSAGALAGMELRARLGIDAPDTWAPPDYRGFLPTAPNPPGGRADLRAAVRDDAAAEVSSLAERRMRLGWRALGGL